MSMSNTIIEPRVGAGPLRLGMTRDEAWSTTRGVVTSFFPQGWSTERMDDFRDFAIHAEYEAGVIVRLVAFTSNRPYVNRSPLSLFEQELGPEAGWDDVVALLELQEQAFVAGDERVDVPELGLVFGFVERGAEDELRLEWIAVEVAGRAKPFTTSGRPGGSSSA